LASRDFAGQFNRFAALGGGGYDNAVSQPRASNAVHDTDGFLATVGNRLCPKPQGEFRLRFVGIDTDDSTPCSDQDLCCNQPNESLADYYHKVTDFGARYPNALHSDARDGRVACRSKGYAFRDQSNEI